LKTPQLKIVESQKVEQHRDWRKVLRGIGRTAQSLETVIKGVRKDKASKDRIVGGGAKKRGTTNNRRTSRQLGRKQQGVESGRRTGRRVRILDVSEKKPKRGVVDSLLNSGQKDVREGARRKRRTLPTDKKRERVRPAVRGSST